MIRQSNTSNLIRWFAVFALVAGSALLRSQSGSSSATLTPYTSCSFPDGLKVVQVDSLPPGISSREVETDSGSRQIDLESGLRIMFAYPGSDFYANVKSELLPAANYAQLKGSLLENLNFLAHGNVVNTSMRSPLNGFEAHGLDRQKLEGGVLGIYLLFDDSSHVVTTIYMLNQEPQDRKFQTIEQYRDLRDRFLASYTACIRLNQKETR